MVQFLVKIGLFVLSAIAICFFKNPIANTLAQTFAALFAGAIFQSAYDNWRYLRYLPRLILIRFQGGKLRISFAALIRIKIGSDYLLVKSKRTPKWQPVGGVYKFFDVNKIHELKLKSDVGFKNTEPNEFRLSFANEHIFNVLKLMKWFESQFGREISPHREYQEELIDTKFLSAEKFQNPEFQYLSREYEFGFAQKFNVWELKIFEIFELKLTSEQQKLLKESVDNQPDKLLLLDQKHIENGGFVDDSKDYQVGEHTKYIL